MHLEITISATHPAANSGIFTADELLKPRSRRMKATAAQQTFAKSDELKLFACVKERIDL